jgi:hypothetical protein
VKRTRSVLPPSKITFSPLNDSHDREWFVQFFPNLSRRLGCELEWDDSDDDCKEDATEEELREDCVLDDDDEFDDEDERAAEDDDGTNMLELDDLELCEEEDEFDDDELASDNPSLVTKSAGERPAERGIPPPANPIPSGNDDDDEELERDETETVELDEEELPSS